MAEERKKYDYESREYQTELFEQAIKENLILYLPTGSGKTYIAILLIKHFNRDEDIIPIKSGGQRTFFLVNTVALVGQQSKQIKDNSCLAVGKYSGDMGVDMWPEDDWIKQLDTRQVLVMTCQIFLNLLVHNIITLKNVNLIVFDECHHGVSNHPMRQTMMLFKGVPQSEQPRILGLTATILNGNIKPHQVGNQIEELEKTFLAKVSTSVNEEMVKMYSTNPREAKVSYIENDTTGVCYNLRDQILNQLKTFIAAVKIDEMIMPPPGCSPKNAKLLDESSKKTNKRLANLIADIQVNMDELGVYGGTLAVLAHLVQIQQLLPNCQLETLKLLYQSITADCTLLRKYFDIEMKKLGLSTSEAVQYYSSDKVKKLFSILKKLKNGDSAIVFVKRRFTAKILYYLMKNASKDDPRLNTIKSNFIVGYNIGNPFKDTRENYMQRNQNKKVMSLFNQGELNVLFASNVVEEGIDITQCNYVIMFDPPMDFRAYVQSKGRARDQNSNYIILVNRSDASFDQRYSQYREVENTLKNRLCGGKTLYREPPSQEEIEKSLFMETPGLEPFRPLGRDGPTVTYLSAVSLINRYFASLINDKFSKICPYWWIQNEGHRCKCFLQLPMESKVNGVIEGTWQKNKEDAKRSAALEACKTLYENGELGEQSMLPIEANDVTLNVKFFTPNIDNSEVFMEKVGESVVRIGTKKNKRIFDKKWADCLCNCRPQPNQKVYLHVLEIKPTYTPPAFNHRLQVFHETLSMSNSFALISTKILPKLAPFPLYMSTGELIATVREAYPIWLDEKQLEKINDFHYTLFNNVLSVVKEFLVRDISNSQNSFLIAPVTLGETQEFVIDWDAIEDSRKPFPSTEKRPSDEKRTGLNITDQNYLLKIVSPWYRTVPSQKYLVTKVCYDMSENSPFPTEIYPTYKKYFKDKYNIDPLTTNQPLIEVRALSSKINCTKPRSLTKVLKKKQKEENADFEVWLMPELCVVYPLHGKYWLKAELVPSVLHRISQLCIAEELRATISRDTGIGPLTLPEGQNWKKLQEDISLLEKEDEMDVQQALRPLAIISKYSATSVNTQNIWGKEEEPLDIERHMEDASIFDIINYGSFLNMPLLKTIAATDGVSLGTLTSPPKKEILQMVKPPKLKMLQSSALCLGPEQVEVMQALTAAEANDFINCERLETLGDSFLKFIISLMLFDTQRDSLEGVLTYIKGAVVGNKNLYFCGKKKNFGSMIQVQSFSPKEEWLAPGFCVEHSIKSVISSVNLDPDLLYSIKMPENDRKAGMMSAETKNQVNDVLLEAEDGYRKCSIFLNQQALADKNISDVVEALLGVYLKGCGISGALKVLNWFEVTNPDLTTPDIFTRRIPSPAKGRGQPEQHMQQPRELENILNYKFQDRAYMLQALTHPSYTRNNITPSYQRLEFLGDAVIDFLITVHIFEKCETLSPGDLTDLRSALVNNITLGALAVRHQLYKFMLYYSSKLNDVMMRFVRHQESRDHVIDDDILFLFEERDVNISEAVDVPKALGDIFESLIGAIYLDSGKDLNVTWKVLYNLMKTEIESFSKDIPKNQVRMLYESNCGPKFISTLESNGAVMVTVEILHKGVLKKFHGFGDNKYQGKRAAAKHALRYMRLN